MLKDASEFAWENSLSGLEFAIGIPGTLGGAVFMNAGAYDGEMSHVVTAVRAVDFKVISKNMMHLTWTLLIVIVYSTIIMKLLGKSL